MTHATASERYDRTNCPVRPRILAHNHAQGRISLGSNSRRFLSRLTGVACLFLVAEALLPIWNFNLDQVRESSIRIAVAWSFAYFVVVVLIPIVLLTGRDFRLQPTRLFNNILLSGAYCVLAFGLLYRKLGFASSIEGMEVRIVADAYYFSAVTFSTLGFGDFRVRTH